MIIFFDYMRGFHFQAIVFRLILAIVFGGILGLDRENKRRPAGFRTYLLVCLGASMAMIIGQYEYVHYGIDAGRLDVSRMGAQVINGIGFLGAGTIIVTNQQEVKGLTTAAGLWASACMGLAIGAGNYECALIGFCMIMICFRMFPRIEQVFANRSRYMNLYLEFQSISDIHQIADVLRNQGIGIYGVELLDKKESITRKPAAIFTLYLNKKQNHEDIIAVLSDHDYILHIDEI